MNNKASISVASDSPISQKQFNCDICQKHLSTEISYLLHTVIHLMPDYFNCQGCQKGFVELYKLETHLEMHNNPTGKTTCQVCYRVFSDDDEHARNHYTECVSTFITKRKMDSEKAKIEIRSDGKYGSCQNERSEQSELKKHDASTNLLNIFICKRCNMVFLEKHQLDEHHKSICIKKELESHEDTKSGFETFTAIDDFHVSDVDNDDETFFSYSNENNEKYGSSQSKSSENFTLEKHNSCDNVQNIFKCDRCKKEFSERHDLDEHQQSICIKKELDSDEDIVLVSSEPLRFQASDSSNAIASRQGSQKLRNILSFTDKEKQHEGYRCACQKFFSSKLKFLVHTQSTVKSFSCIVCQMTFYKKCLLEKHYRSHIAEKSQKQFECSVCCKKFTNEILLNVHKHTHVTSPPYICDVCSNRSYSSDMLLQHYLIHTGESPFKYAIRGKGFRERNLLIKHINQIQTPKDSLSVNLEEDNLKCETCGKDFTPKQSYLLRRTGETSCGRFLCIKCILRKSKKKLYAFKSCGKKNESNFISKEVFGCDFCGRKFTQKQYLEAHYQIVHIKRKDIFCE